MFDIFNIYPPNPEEKIDNVKNVEIIGNYVTITFTYLSMIVSEGYLIDFLDEMLHETRVGIHQLRCTGLLNHLKENGYGIRIKVYAGIGGAPSGIEAPSVILYTPEEIQALIQ